MAELGGDNFGNVLVLGDDEHFVLGELAQLEAVSQCEHDREFLGNDRGVGRRAGEDPL